MLISAGFRFRLDALLLTAFHVGIVEKAICFSFCVLSRSLKVYIATTTKHSIEYCVNVSKCMFSRF